MEKFLKTYNISLNAQQQEAAKRIQGETLLLAVPGSGKTTVIISRLGYMIKALNIDPQTILTLTFSRAGTRDLKHRYIQYFGTDENPSFSTIHSFSLKIIRTYERQIKQKAFAILEEQSKILAELYFKRYKTKPTENDMAEILTQESLVRNMMFTDQAIKKIQVGNHPFHEIHQDYQTYKKKNRLMDFDDILWYALKLLQKKPILKEHFIKTYQYINIDEAQDTSKLQFKILEEITNKQGNIFMVGDEDQSIYGFRGAYPQGLLNFTTEHPQGKILLMETNYRSTQSIVRAADHFIKQNTMRKEKNMNTPNASGFAPNKLTFKTKSEQYQFLINAIKLEGKEIAILYRNNESAIPLVDALERADVLYRLKEHNPLFFTHFLPRDILNFYALGLDPTDIERFEQNYYKMDCMISKSNLNYVKSCVKGNVFNHLLRMPDAPKWLIDKVKNQKKRFEKLVNLKPERAINYIFDEMGYQKFLDDMRGGEQGDNLTQKRRVLCLLASRTKNWEEFTQRLEVLEKILRGETKSRRGVTLSTIHSSKGLEFEKVFIIDAVKGEFPSLEAVKEKEKDPTLYEEEVRLFYVGTTRAKKELSFLVVDGIPKQSPFIEEFLREKKPQPLLKKRETIRKKKPFIQKIQKEISPNQLKDWKEGDWVEHKIFGKGQIATIKGSSAQIIFQGKIRKLDIGVCVHNGIINKNQS